MATRWQKLIEDLNLKDLVNKDKLDPIDIPNFERLTSLEFTCPLCKYNWTGYHEYACTEIENCREGFADYLNEDVGDEG